MVMEENLAILFADLSGYTALTETHGASSAADMIDRFLSIVNSCLVGESVLKESTGDEVMVVSSSADCLLSTAALLMRVIAKEENFLQVHGGLHYGKVLKRNNRYFGAAINLTARIAAKASPGSFWCSFDFIDALSDKTTLNFELKGKHSFKNVNEEKHVAEIVNVSANAFVIDPICRMLILDKSNAVQHPEKADFFFCSQACLDSFTACQDTDG